MARHLLFDLDGTLIDTVGDLADSVNAVLAATGRPVHPEAAYKVFVGAGIRALVQRAFGEMPPDDFAEALAAVKAEYTRRWNVRTRPYPGIPDLLNTLEQRGIRKAILSNKPDAMTQVVVQEFLGNWHWDRIRGAREDTPLKPDPKGAVDSAKELGMTCSDILYVGDTGTDMETARAAGMHAVGVLWGFRGEEELRAAGAEHILTRPDELLNLL
jgi:phosphoglycolate phosphatase